MYTNAWFCVNCDHQLTRDEHMTSNGRCPYCGFKAPSAITIVRTYDKPVWVEPPLTFTQKVLTWINARLD